MIVAHVCPKFKSDQIRTQLRCRNMADAINRTVIHSARTLDLDAFANNTEEAQAVCSKADIIVIYRYLYGQVLAAVQYWKARDKKVIVDFDQAVNLMTPDMTGYSFWFEGVPPAAIDSKDRIDPVPLEQFKWGLGMVDAACAASVRLMSDWTQYTRVHLVPDFINTYQYPLSEKNHEDEIWIGLGSSVNYNVLQQSGLLESMEQAARKRPQIRFILCNPETSNGLAFNIPPSQIKVHYPQSFDEWVGILLKLDIGLVPSSGSYDQRLGSARLLEFMIAKVPWLASGQPQLSDASQYGQWVGNSAEEWEKAILDTVDNLAAWQKKAAKDPFLYAISQDIGANIDKVLRIYTSIINQA